MAGKRREGAMWRGNRRRGHTPALFAAAALLAAALVAGGALLRDGGETAAPAGLRINELMSDNASTALGDAGEATDWVELYNGGGEPVPLKGYSLVLGSEINKIFSFPDETLAPGAYALVYCEGMDRGAAHGDWSAPFRLPASGGVTLALLGPNDRALDSVALPELGADEVYARGEGDAWEPRRIATPGAGNAASAGSEGPRLAPGAVELSEVCSDNTLYFPDAGGACHDYVELHNRSAEAVNLGGWHLSDSAGDLTRWTFPELTLEAGGYLAVHCSGLDRSEDAAHLHANFRLGEGESVFLSDSDARPVSEVAPGALATDQAWSLVDGVWSAELAPTPGAENTPEAAARINAERFGGAQLQLSEIMASAMEEPCDWIELRNATNQAIDLSGYGISDRSDHPRKWQFPKGTTLRPGEYLGVLLSGREGAKIGDYLNADFSISATGGCTVTLADPSGRVLDAAYLPRQYGGTSYGRAEGEEGFFYFDRSTPREANAGAHYRVRAAEAVCSQAGGLFEAGERLRVTLDAPAGSRVYYTLDGSDPDEGATPYVAPIEIQDTAILRTRVYRDGCMPSLIDTQSYLYGVRNESSVYVVSLVTDMDNLTGPEGMTTEENLMREIEREAHVEIFLPDGTNVISQGCGISLHGGGSRMLPIKSFNLIARSAYGPNRFNYPIFSQRDYETYQSILLRPSGEDQSMSFMRDSVLSSLMRDSSLMYQEAEICTVYLNGEYYTLCYLRERINKHSICQFEGWEGMEDDIDFTRGNDTVLQGSNESYANLLKWVREHDMTTDEAFAHLDARIDVQNYIEYMAIEIFTGNADLLNVRRYRNSRADGKWHWALFDLDWGFYNDVNSIARWLRAGGTGSSNATDNTLFIGCMLNPTFRSRFLSYMGEQLNTNFSTENVLAKFEERYQRIEPMLDQYKQRWGFKLSGIDEVIDYARTRPRKLIGYFRETLKLSDADLEKYFGAAIQKILESGEGNS